MWRSRRALRRWALLLSCAAMAAVRAPDVRAENQAVRKADSAAVVTRAGASGSEHGAGSGMGSAAGSGTEASSGIGTGTSSGIGSKAAAGSGADPGTGSGSTTGSPLGPEGEPSAEPAPASSARTALEHLEHLVSLGPRPGDSAAARAAAAYLITSLESLGLTVEEMPVGKIAVPAISFAGHERPRRVVETADPNLLVRFGPPLSPTAPALLIMAHYDSVAASPGAADNAAAVAVLLDAARALAARPPPQPVLLAFTAREEDGLVGARALAARADLPISFAVSLDLLGTSGALSLNGASKLIRRAELQWIAEAAARAQVAVEAPLAHRALSRLEPSVERSDHGPFTMRGVRAVHFYHRGAGGELIDLAYHGRHDTADRILPAKLDEATRLVLALTAAPPPLAAPPTAAGRFAALLDRDDGLWPPLSFAPVMPRRAWVLAQLAGAALALLFLATTRRLAPSRPRGLGLLPSLLVLALCGGALFGLERLTGQLTAADHPAPWLHHPLRSTLGLALVGAGLVTFCFGVLRRVVGLRGERRYLAAAVALLCLQAGALIAFDAWELSWLWLLPALLLAAAPRLGLAAPLALALAAVPTALLLEPAHLREAYYQGAYPLALPLAGWLTLQLLPHALAALWWLAPRPRPSPGREIFALGASLAFVALGTSLLVTTVPTCSQTAFHLSGLACELRASPTSPASR